MTVFLSETMKLRSQPDTFQQMAPIQNAGLRASLGLGYNPDITPSCGVLEIKQNKASCALKQPWHRHINSDMSKTFLVVLSFLFSH